MRGRVEKGIVFFCCAFFLDERGGDEKLRDTELYN
jgi:hypothetical protein